MTSTAWIAMTLAALALSNVIIWRRLIRNEIVLGHILMGGEITIIDEEEDE
jgi:hypothetical protein